MTSPIRIGVIGANPEEGWAARSHLPALQALEQYELVAVCTTRMETAKQSAEKFGARLAFDNAQALIDHPDVDMVTVTLKTPKHREYVMAVAAAGKHVFSEWPLGANLQESEEMAAAVRHKPFRSMVGLQGRTSPWINAIRDIVHFGKLGRILSTSMVISGRMLGSSVEERAAYTLDRRNGATMLTITFGHMLDSMLYCLGEMSELSSLLKTQRSEIRVGKGMLPMTASDQIAVTSLLENGAVASIHMRSGMSRATNILWEINGTEGDLVVTNDHASLHINPLEIRMAIGSKTEPEKVKVGTMVADAPCSLLGSPAFNVACLYAAFARDLRDGGRRVANFDDALARLRLLDLIHHSNKQGLRLPVVI